MEVLRQKLLVVYMATSSLESPLIAWSVYDGSSPSFPTAGTEDEPPYASVFAAMQDGWQVMQVSPSAFPGPHPEQESLHFKYRVILEQQVVQDGSAS